MWLINFVTLAEKFAKPGNSGLPQILRRCSCSLTIYIYLYNLWCGPTRPASGGRGRDGGAPPSLPAPPSPGTSAVHALLLRERGKLALGLIHSETFLQK